MTHRMLCVTLLAACGSDPISYSTPVGINLKVKSSDASSGAISDEKAITTETGNPYGAFVNDARTKLGRDPAVIDVDHVELFLAAGSTNVTALGEVFAGQVDVLFQMNDSGTSYPVASGTIDATTGLGPLVLATDFAGNSVPDIDYGAMLTGSFKTITRGPAAAGFGGKGAEADLQVTFTFAAFE